MERNIWLVASGKGGVGKSTVCAGLAAALARQQKSVALVDGDVGLRCADIMLGVQDRVVYDLKDCLDRRCQLADALLPCPDIPGLSLLPAAQDAKLSDIKSDDLERLLRTLSRRFQYVFIDCPAGIGRNFKCWTGAAYGCVLVVTPDDMSVRDAERMAALIRKRGVNEFWLVVNRVDPALVQTGEMQSPHTVATYLDIPLLAAFPDSREIKRSQLAGHTIEQCGDKKIALAVERMALRFQGADADMEWYDPKIGWLARVKRALGGGVGA